MLVSYELQGHYKKRALHSYLMVSSVIADTYSDVEPIDCSSCHLTSDSYHLRYPTSSILKSMGKGSNYVNNNKGVFLQKSKKNVPNMPMCQYGGGCTRPTCIYRHPTSKDPSFYQQSKEPCIAFLAGTCAFDANGCLKRHPPKEEADRLRAKYKKTRCRFGDECNTTGCIYLHPSDQMTQEVSLNRHSRQDLAWDNQCQFVPPPQPAVYQYQRAHQHNTSLPSQDYYAQGRNPPMEFPYQNPNGHTAASLPDQSFVPSAAAPEFVPNPTAKAFVPGAKEFVPGNWKRES